MDIKKTLTMPKGKFPMRANLPSWEGDMAKSWNERDIYELMLQNRSGKKPFYLHDGPPYAMVKFTLVMRSTKLSRISSSARRI